MLNFRLAGNENEHSIRARLVERRVRVDDDDDDVESTSQKSDCLCLRVADFEQRQTERETRGERKAVEMLLLHVGAGQKGNAILSLQVM